MRISLFAITALLVLELCSSAKKSGNDSDDGTFNAGFMVVTMQVTEDGVTRNLDVAVWYPTSAEPQPYCYSGPTYGHVAPDAAPLTCRGTFPMLAFSHGCGGCGISSAFLSQITRC